MMFDISLHRYSLVFQSVSTQTSKLCLSWWLCQPVCTFTQWLHFVVWVPLLLLVVQVCEPHPLCLLITLRGWVLIHKEQAQPRPLVIGSDSGQGHNVNNVASQYFWDCLLEHHNGTKQAFSQVVSVKLTCINSVGNPGLANRVETLKCFIWQIDFIKLFTVDRVSF